MAKINYRDPESGNWKELPIGNTKSELVDIIYPVGSIYMSVNNTTPATFFGGTWEQIQDRFLLSAGDTYKNGETGGEATHTLTIAEMPPHNHGCRTYSGSNIDKTQWSIKSIENSFEGRVFTDNAGGGQPHNNMPPYLVVYVWKRTA